MEYVPETIYRVVKHYNKTKRPIPMLYIKLYMYQGKLHSRHFSQSRHIRPFHTFVSLSCSFPRLYSRDGRVPPRHQTAEFASRHKRPRGETVRLWKASSPSIKASILSPHSPSFQREAARQRRAQHCVHLQPILSRTRADIWSYRLFSSD